MPLGPKKFKKPIANSRQIGYNRVIYEIKFTINSLEDHEIWLQPVISKTV